MTVHSILYSLPRYYLKGLKVIFWVGVCNCNWHPPPNWCTKCGSFFLEIYGMSKLSWFSTRYTIHKRWLADFSIQNGGIQKAPLNLNYWQSYLNSLLLRAKASEELFGYFITSWCMHMIGSSTSITLVVPQIF